MKSRIEAGLLCRPPCTNDSRTNDLIKLMKQIILSLLFSLPVYGASEHDSSHDHLGPCGLWSGVEPRTEEPLSLIVDNRNTDGKSAVSRRLCRRMPGKLENEPPGGTPMATEHDWLWLLRKDIMKGPPLSAFVRKYPVGIFGIQSGLNNRPRGPGNFLLGKARRLTCGG
jgi:hypothetical protein